MADPWLELGIAFIGFIFWVIYHVEPKKEEHPYRVRRASTRMGRRVSYGASRKRRKRLTP